MNNQKAVAHRLNAELARNAMRKQASGTLVGAGIGSALGVGGAYLVAKHLTKKAPSVAGLIGGGLLGAGIGGTVGYGISKLKSQQNRIAQLSNALAAKRQISDDLRRLARTAGVSEANIDILSDPELISEMQIQLDNTPEYTGKIIADKDVELMHDLLADEPGIFNNIMDYHSYLSNARKR